MTGGGYGLLKGGYGLLTGKSYQPETYNLGAAENEKTFEQFMADLGAKKTLEESTVQTASDDFNKKLRVLNAESSEEVAFNTSKIVDGIDLLQDSAESRQKWGELYGLDEQKIADVFEANQQAEILPHLLELKNKSYDEYLQEYFEKFGLNLDESVDVQEDTLTITDKNGKKLLELEGLSKYTNEELGEILDEVTTTADNTSPPIETDSGTPEKTSLEKAAESLEETKKTLEDPMFYSSFFGSNLDYIERIKELAAVGMAHPAQITHAANLAEDIRQALINAYNTLGVRPNEAVAKIVDLDMSQFSTVEVGLEATSVEVPENETVDVKADTTVSEESKALLAQEVESVTPIVTADTEVNGESLAQTVSTVESQKPQVGVYLYIAQNITIPSSVNVGVNYYPLNSPSNFGATSENLTAYARGGYTGNYNGPAWVDPEEVILNKAQQLGIIKSLSGSNKSGGDVHIHYDLSGAIITGFKDVDDFVRYASEQTIKEYKNQKGEI